jgi:Protein of unknown function (DUF3467)
MTEPFAEAPNIEGLPIVYTNWLRAIPAPFEFGLDFGYIQASAEALTEPPKAAVRIVMTWEYAKLLRNALQEIIEQREGNVGEITLPEGILVAQVKAAGEDE